MVGASPRHAEQRRKKGEAGVGDRIAAHRAFSGASGGQETSGPATQKIPNVRFNDGIVKSGPATVVWSPPVDRDS